MILPKRLELPIDIGGLIVALVVDIVMNVVCFATLAPDMITRVAFVSIGIMIVLFVPRSWSKRQFAAWAVFTLVVFFFDYSFSLVATKAQSSQVSVNVYDDAEVKRLEAERATHEGNISALQTQYAAAAKRETMDQINGMIGAERTLVTRALAARDARIAELKRTTARARITSREIFTAIPDAARDRRVIELVVFGLIFIGLQLIIATSIDNNVWKIDNTPDSAPMAFQYVEPPTAAHAPTHDEIDAFVKISWLRADGGTDPHILPRDTFMAYMSQRGTKITPEIYDAILARAVVCGVLSTDGVIIEKNKENAIRHIDAARRSC